MLTNYSIDPFQHIQINRWQHSETIDALVHPDQSLWNLLLFAIVYDQTHIVNYLLTSGDFKNQVTYLAILRPPDTN